jgi:hypothetical protein
LVRKAEISRTTQVQETSSNNSREAKARRSWQEVQTYFT